MTINAAKFVEMAKEVRSNCRGRNDRSETCKGCVFSIKYGIDNHNIEYACMFEGLSPADWELDDAWGTK